jgi:uncharacterized membrane protein YgdD (TMEM256/DUF423 family)
MHTALFVFLGGLLAALAVGLGAIGAHALKTQLTPEQLETYYTAVQYQMIHAIGLVVVGLLALYHRSRLFDVADDPRARRHRFWQCQYATGRHCQG